MVHQLAMYMIRGNLAAKLKKTLFIGGNMWRRPSVRIRCVDIARHLGCHHHLLAQSAAEISRDYSIFICVKPEMSLKELAKLSQLGTVIWDVIDVLPPHENISAYITSTSKVQNMITSMGSAFLIPHHHCNDQAQYRSSSCRTLGWIGHRHWCPDLREIEFKRYYIEGMTRSEVARAHLEFDIGLNLRAVRKKQESHINLNSGIKLINCIGFGLPSISSDEPAYHEFGSDCTLFTTLENCGPSIHSLQNDEALYHKMRSNCIARAPQFHIETIANRYKHLIDSVA